MIHISNLRTESAESWTKLIADITYGGGGHNFLAEPTMWLAVKDECAHMLASDVYDAFMLVPLYMGMYHKEDLHIHGCVSKRLYKNVMNYLQRILCDFSDDLSRINVTVDGFKTADGDPNIIGAGFSCGVDSLSTVYDWYVNETDPDYKINALFFFNTGWHGDYYHEGTKKLCLDRYGLNKHAADELGLPLYLIDSNFHAFSHKIYPLGAVGRMGYIANYSCTLGLQRAVRKYYVASGGGYEGVKSHGYHNADMAGFCDTYMVPLIRTEKLEFIVDGCQYNRTQKTERISDWDIAHRFLNPCNTTSNSTVTPHNCSRCGKFLRTLIAIEALGKLEAFSSVFDLAIYRKYSFKNKCRIVLSRKNGAHEGDNYKFAIEHGLKMPSTFMAYVRLIPSKIFGFFFGHAVSLLRRIIGDASLMALRRKLFKPSKGKIRF